MARKTAGLKKTANRGKIDSNDNTPLVLRLVGHPNLALASRLIVGVVFLVSAMAKLAFPDEFIMAVQSYDILPDPALRPVALAFPWLELLTGAFLAAGFFTRFVATVATVLMVSFIGLMTVALAQGKSIDCGCFTGIISETIGPSTFARDLVFLALVLPIFKAPLHRLSLDIALRPFSIRPVRNLGLAAIFFFITFGLGMVPFWVNASARPSTRLVQATDAANPLIQPQNNGWRLGPKQAKVEIVVFSDFQCPGCRLVANNLKKLITKHNGLVSVTYRHYPLTSHELAWAAAEATEAAGEQGRFWSMHDAIFANQTRLSTNNLRSIAGQLGLDLQRYDAALASGRPKARVQADIDEGKRIGVSFTPYVLIDGETIRDYSNDAFNQEIEKKIRAGNQ